MRYHVTPHLIRSYFTLQLVKYHFSISLIGLLFWRYFRLGQNLRRPRREEPPGALPVTQPTVSSTEASILTVLYNSIINS